MRNAIIYLAVTVFTCAVSEKRFLVNKQAYGSSCTEASDCVTAKAQCSGNPHVCRCDSQFYHDTDSDTCKLDLGSPCALNSSDLSSVKAQLRIDEGYKTRIYIDTEGHSTFGIGHLITRNDREYGKFPGTYVSSARIESVFDADLAAAVVTTHSIFGNCSSWPSEVKQIVVNMVFNLGNRLRGFTDFIAAVNNNDWDTAADEMVDSIWYRQTGDRAKRLVERMRKI
uniref:Phage lysozyme 3 n=1 Tax=Mercenaria mercenaria TaxID=6596 RepID=A0AAU8BVE5_MERMC